MAQPPVYPQMPPEPQAISPKKSNTVLWVVLILGIGGLCLVILILAAVLFPVFSKARFAVQQNKCLSNIRLTGFSLVLYRADYDDRLPPAVAWMDSADAYGGSRFRMGCPIVEREAGPQAFGYGFNDALSGIGSSKIKEPERTVMIFESLGTGKNVHGGEDELVLPGRHGTGSKAGSNYGYVGGEAKFVLDNTRSDSWKP